MKLLAIVSPQSCGVPLQVDTGLAAQSCAKPSVCGARCSTEPACSGLLVVGGGTTHAIVDVGGAPAPAGLGALAAVAGAAEGAEVGGVVGAAIDDRLDVVDFEGDVVEARGAAADFAAVLVAFEDLVAELGRELAARGWGGDVRR